MAKVVGQSKVYLNYRISVAEIKGLLDIEEGDRVYFVEDRGEVKVRKMKP